MDFYHDETQGGDNLRLKFATKINPKIGILATTFDSIALSDIIFVTFPLDLKGSQQAAA